MDMQHAERVTKEAAKKRQITIELTPDQLAGLKAHYKQLNPAEAAELIFTEKGEVQAVLKVAGYSYTGDTCCV